MTFGQPRASSECYSRWTYFWETEEASRLIIKKVNGGGGGLGWPLDPTAAQDVLSHSLEAWTSASSFRLQRSDTGFMDFCLCEVERKNEHKGGQRGWSGAVFYWVNMFCCYFCLFCWTCVCLHSLGGNSLDLGAVFSIFFFFFAVLQFHGQCWKRHEHLMQIDLFDMP